jgi:hypothetical protein
MIQLQPPARLRLVFRGTKRAALAKHAIGGAGIRATFPRNATIAPES